MEVYGEAAAGVDAAVLRALGVRQLVTTEGPLAGSWLLAGTCSRRLRWPVAAAEPWPAPQPLLHPPAPPAVRVLSAPAALTPRQPSAVPSSSAACSAPPPPPPPPPAADEPKGQKKPCASQLFRLRQKGLINDLEQKVAHKLSELQLLSDQNDRLRRRADVLRAAVEGRNHQIGILASPPAGAPSQSRPPAPAAAAAAAAAGPCPAVAAASGEPAQSWWERTDGAVAKEELEAATQAEVVCLFMDYVAACRRGLAALAEEEEDGECAMDEGEGGSSEGRGAMPAPPTSTGAADAPTAATGADGAGGQPADGCQPPAGGLFLFDSSIPRPAAGSARRVLFDLVNTRIGMVKHLLLLHPKIIVPLIGVDLQTGARAEGSEYGHAFWARVVAALALSEEQRAGIVAARELHEREMASILEERAALQAELAGTQPLGAHADVPAQLGSDWDDATTWQMEAAEALSRNIQKEQAARGLLYHFLFGGNTLSFVQMARLQVASFPFVADADAIAEAVWLEAGAPDAAAPPPPPGDPSLCQRKEPTPNERAARAAARAQRA